MPIPDYETLMFPVLRFAADAQEHSMKELVPAIGSQLRLMARSEGVLAQRRHEIGTHRRADAGGYMFDFGLGVSTVATYEIKRLDSDYFDEE